MKLLDIAEVSSLSGVSPSALRFYEKKGLICSIGRNGLRRQYNQEVINKLALISLGRTAGFSLKDIAAMFDSEGKITIKREFLIDKVREVNKTIRWLKKVSDVMKHVAYCPAQDHMQCPEFIKVLSKAHNLTSVQNKK